MPILPFINDTPANIKDIVVAAADHGARFIYPAFGVTLRIPSASIFTTSWMPIFPASKEYLRSFGNAYSCASPQAKSLWATFTRECQRQGLLYKMEDIITRYKLEHGSHCHFCFSQKSVNKQKLPINLFDFCLL